VQAQDEVLHQRKIINYFQERSADYKLDFLQAEHLREEKNAFPKNIEAILESLLYLKKKCLSATNELVDKAIKVNDFLTVKFLD
jgi:ferritin